MEPRRNRNLFFWTRNPNLIAILCLFFLCTAAYANSFYGAFVFDDSVWLGTLTYNRLQISLLDWFIPCRPFFAASLILNYLVGGENPWTYHLFNFAVHFANGLLVFDLLRRTLSLACIARFFRERALEIAFLVSSLWIVHPLNTSAVTWIYHRDDSLCALLLLLTLYANLRSTGSISQRAWEQIGAMSCFFAMGVKQIAVVIPVLVFIYDWLFLHRDQSFLQIIRQKSYFYFCLSLCWFFLALLTLVSPKGPNQGADYGVTSWEYLRTQPEVLFYYVRLTLWPHPLLLDHMDWSVENSPLKFLSAGFSVLALIFLTLDLFIRRRLISFLGSWFFIILAPTSSFIPLAGELLAERRMYLPLVSLLTLFVLIGFQLHQWLGSHRLKTWQRSFAGGGLFLYFSFLALFLDLTIERNKDFYSEYDLYTAALKYQPANSRSLYNLAWVQFLRGDYENALVTINRSVKLFPEFGDSYVLRGMIFNSKGNEKAALTDFDKAFSGGVIPPDIFGYLTIAAYFETQGKFDVALNYYKQAPSSAVLEGLIEGRVGNVLTKMERYPEAAQKLQRALQLGRKDPFIYFDLGSIMLIYNQKKAAVTFLQQAVDGMPNSAEARFNFGFALEQAGEADKAVEQLQKAISLDPSLQKPYQILAWIYSTDPQLSLKNRERGLSLAKTAYEKAEQKRDPALLDTLAAAEANNGLFDEEIKNAKRAMEAAKKPDQAKLAEEIRAREKLYEQAKPYRVLSPAVPST